MIIGFTGIGNLVFFHPVMRNIKSHYPDCKITLITFNSKLDILVQNNLVDKIHVYPDFTHYNSYKYIKLLTKFILQMIKLRQKRYDISFVPFSGTSVSKYHLLSWLINAKKRYIHISNKQIFFYRLFNDCKTTENVHDVFQNLNLIRDMVKNPSPAFYFKKPVLREEDQQLFQNAVDSKLIKIGLQPGVKAHFDDSRRWPAEKYIQLINMISKKIEVCVYLFGVEEEREILDLISSGITCEKKLFCGENLDKVIDVISLMDYFVGNDSSLLHIATTFSIPVLGLYGPTNPTRTAPFTSNSIFIKASKFINPKYQLGFESDYKNGVDVNFDELSATIVYKRFCELLKC